MSTVGAPLCRKSACRTAHACGRPTAHCRSDRRSFQTLTGINLQCQDAPTQSMLVSSVSALS
eukprot:14224804-Alexandrium_andersonii.AAC.1